MPIRLLLKRLLLCGVRSDPTVPGSSRALHSSLATRFGSRLGEAHMTRRADVLIPVLIAALAALIGSASSRREARAPSAAAEFTAIPRRHEQSAIRREIVGEKLRTALLPAMREAGIDMWIIVDRENNADPLHDEIGGGYSGPGAAFVFFDFGGGAAEKIYLGQEQPLNSMISQLYDQKQYPAATSRISRSFCETP